MVTWWKRLLFSLASVLVAAMVCMGCMIAVDAVFKPVPGGVRSSEAVLTIAVTVGFSMVAWFVSTPAVLIVRNFRGPRFWVYLVLGSCVGPLLMMALFAAVYLLVPHSPNDHWIRPELRPLLYLAAGISSLTSLFYLLCVRWTENRGMRRAAEVESPTV
jgi:hypothetical protein